MIALTTSALVFAAPDNNKSGSNEAGGVAKPIADAMSHKQKDGTIQRDMVLAMFESEVSFSTDAIKRMFSGKTTAASDDKIVALMKEISPAYVNKLDMAANVQKQASKLTGKRGENAEKDPLLIQVEELKKQTNAALAMFKRAMKAVYALRMLKADDVLPADKTGGSIKYTVPKVTNDPKTGKEKTTYLERMDTGNGLESKGTDYLKSVLKRSGRVQSAGANKTTANIGAIAIPVAVNTFETFLSKVDEANFSEEEAKAMDKLLHVVMRDKFADDRGVIDPKLVIEWIKAEGLDVEPKPVPQAPDAVKPTPVKTPAKQKQAAANATRNPTKRKAA